MDFTFRPGKAWSYAESTVPPMLGHSAKLCVWIRSGLYITLALTIIAVISYTSQGGATFGICSMSIGAGGSLIMIGMLVHEMIRLRKAHAAFYETFGQPEEVQSSIFLPSITVNQKFNAQVKTLIKQIKQNDVGKAFLDQLAKTGNSILISPGERSEYHHYLNLRPKTHTISLREQPLNQKLKTYSLDGQLHDQPAHVTLFHELVHAYRALTQAPILKAGSVNPYLWTNEEEYCTIMGPPESQGVVFTENAFRKAENLPLRFGHLGYKREYRSPLQAFERKRIAAVGERYQEWYAKNDKGTPPYFSLSDADFKNSYSYLLRFKNTTTATIFSNEIQKLADGANFVKIPGKMLPSILSKTYYKEISEHVSMDQCMAYRLTFDERRIFLSQS